MHARLEMVCSGWLHACVAISVMLPADYHLLVAVMAQFGSLSLVRPVQMQLAAGAARTAQAAEQRGADKEHARVCCGTRAAGP